MGLLFGVFLLGVVIDVIDDAALWRAGPLSPGRLTYLGNNLLAFSLFLTVLLARTRVALVALIALTAFVVTLYSDTLSRPFNPQDRAAARAARHAPLPRP